MADAPNQINLQCVNTPDKARGMNSMSNIPLAPFFHSEEPYAMVRGEKSLICEITNYIYFYFFKHHMLPNMQGSFLQSYCGFRKSLGSSFSLLLHVSLQKQVIY